MIEESILSLLLQRKSEMHGLKDILVRESDKRARETADLRVHVDAGIASVEEALEREVSQMGAGARTATRVARALLES